MESAPQPNDNILQTIGNTPLVRINRIGDGTTTPVYAKCEFMNPGGSVKDRIGIAIIDDAEKSGALLPGGTIVEGTSGNTGVGLALTASIRGYRCIFTIPDKMSIEKVKLLKAFGAEVIVTPTVGPEHPEYYVTVAKNIVANTENAVLANQFYNQANPDAHYRSTGPELWAQTEGRITHFVGGMGTGGTMTGVARYLKEQNPEIKVIGADPLGSVIGPFKRNGTMPATQPYKVEGIGNDKIPGTLDLQLIDEIRNVNDKDAFRMTRRITREEGLFVGGSSGLAMVTALELAREVNDPDALIVVLMPDTGERYLSKVHSDEWMHENRFLTREEAVAKELVQGSGRIESLISATPQTTIAQALELMNEHGITQIPVLEDGECVGSARESSLLNLAYEDKATLQHSLANVMEAPFPVVSADAPLNRIASLFNRECKAVLVREGMDINGIITRYDLLAHLSAG